MPPTGDAPADAASAPVVPAAAPPADASAVVLAAAPPADALAVAPAVAPVIAPAVGPADAPGVAAAGSTSAVPLDTVLDASANSPADVLADASDDAMHIARGHATDAVIAPPSPAESEAVLSPAGGASLAAEHAAASPAGHAHCAGSPPPVATVEQGQQTTPDKQIVPSKAKKRRSADAVLLDNLPSKINLVEIPLNPHTSKRARTRTLEFWRGERQILERLPGSAMPTVRSVLIERTEFEPDEALPLKTSPTGRPAPVLDGDSLDAMVSATPSPKRARGAARGSGSGRGGRGSAGQRARGKIAMLQKRGCRRRDEEERADGAAVVEEHEGYMEIGAPAGSLHSCKIRMGASSSHWLCCDIRIPPRSFNEKEVLGPGRSLIITCMNAYEGDLSVIVDGLPVVIRRGDYLALEANMSYSLRNDSSTESADVKLVLVSSLATAS